MMKYSVIIPVYNADKTLGRCLDSLIAQERDDIEFLAVNDGSTDESEKILTEYGNKSNSLKFISQANAGVSAARNAGLALAQGEYILFVDSDDYVAKDYFLQLDAFGKEDLCLFSREEFSSRGTTFNDRSFFTAIHKTGDFSDIASSMIAGKKMMPPWNKRFKREIIEQFNIRFCTRFSIAEDLDFCMQYLLHCSDIAFSDQILYHLDVSDQDSLSRKYRPDLHKQLKRVYTNIESAILIDSRTKLNKRKIIHAVDYLYSKCAFTCSAEEQKRKQCGYFKNRKLYREISRTFENRICDTDGYLNKVHLMMRLLIRCRMTLLIYLGSGAGKRARRLKRGLRCTKSKY